MLAATPPTAYPHVNALLDEWVAQLQAALGHKLVGVYLYGSLVTGDFDDAISDIDLLAATTNAIDEADFEALKALHAAFVAQHPEWDDRIEIAYLSLDALRTFKTKTSLIAIVSPGEPFHFRQADNDWSLNWYMVREKGVMLYGPSPKTIIAPVSKQEFLQTVRGHLDWWRVGVDEMRQRGGQAYAILTLCRALYTLTHGEQVSKRQAALWAARELPQWSPLIHNALAWRQAMRAETADGEATFAETRRFVHAVIDTILG